MVLSATSSATANVLDPSLAVTPAITAFSNSPLGYWWTQVFQQQAKLEQALTGRLTIKLPASQAMKLQTAMESSLQTLRLQLLEAFQACKATLQPPSITAGQTLTWLETSQRQTVLALIAQQTQWANKLKTLLPESKTKVAQMQQLAFIETVVPSVLLQPNTVRILTSQPQDKATSLPLTDLLLLEEGIHWLKASSPLAWGDLITNSLSEVAVHYTTAFHTLPTLSQEKLSALLGVLLLGANYYYYWITAALSQKEVVTTAAFWETEALLFEALQFFNTGCVKTVLWHQQLEKLKPATIKLSSLNASPWFEVLETGVPAKFQATAKQYDKGKQLQAKLQAGCFISAIGDDDTHRLWETLHSSPSQPIDIYACLQKITETPCDIKEMLSAVWVYQLQTQVPQWLAWMENPSQDQWQGLTNQLMKHETSVLKSIETALLHKTVLGEEV